MPDVTLSCTSPHTSPVGRWPFRLSFALGMLWALGMAHPAGAQTGGERPPDPPGLDLPVHEIHLDNGMRVLALPRETSPTVALVVRYEVGGVNETAGETGIAHLLEHLLFKGTSRIGTTDVEAERRLFARMDAIHDSVLSERVAAQPDSARIHALETRISELEDSARIFVDPNAFERILTRAGARGLNATTTAEATTYFVELPANRLELWFALESARMQDPVFREFYTERDVVLEERRLRVETQPGGLLFERYLAEAYQVHPYGTPVVGTRADLETLSRDRVEAYYRDFYGAGNTTVAIVGDVDPEQVEALARRWFGPVRSGRPVPTVLATEPEQRAERRIQIDFDAEPSMRIGWHIPDPLHPDVPALSMLTGILTGGRTSVLYRELVEKQKLAAWVTSTIEPGERYPLLFTLQAAPLAPHTAEGVEAAIYSVLDSLSSTPPAAADLERIRTQLLAADYRRLAGNLGLALQLASSVALHDDWRTTFRSTAALREVTPQELSQVIRRYLVSENRTVAILRRTEGR